jgi:hypothetical protein
LILLPVHTYKQPQSQARRGPLKLLLFAIAGVLLIALCASSYAGAQTDFEQPDVLVLVMGMGAYDQCSINYTSVVPTKTAQADLDTIAKLGKWRVSNAKGETKSSGGPNPKPTTSITWQSQGVIGYANGTLPLEPLVTALKRFRLIEALYWVPSGFQFHGLKSFENEYVTVRLMPGENPCRYRIVVKDKGFDNLDLPLTQPAKSKPELKQGMSAAARVGLALGIGIPAAMMVYLIALYFSRRR